MTINTWRNEIAKVCKTCPRFFDRGRNRYRYRCKKFNCGIYEAYGCNRLRAVMEEAARISAESRLKALNDLVNMGKEETK